LDFHHRAFFISGHRVARYPLPVREIDHPHIDAMAVVFEILDASSQAQTAEALERLKRRQVLSGTQVLKDLLTLRGEIHESSDGAGQCSPR
jgi:hypothetical protein